MICHCPIETSAEDQTTPPHMLVQHAEDGRRVGLLLTIPPPKEPCTTPSVFGGTGHHPLECFQSSTPTLLSRLFIESLYIVIGVPDARRDSLFSFSEGGELKVTENAYCGHRGPLRRSLSRTMSWSRKRGGRRAGHRPACE
jgi:hypothetical protein